MSINFKFVSREEADEKRYVIVNDGAPLPNKPSMFSRPLVSCIKAITRRYVELDMPPRGKTRIIDVRTNMNVCEFVPREGGALVLRSSAHIAQPLTYHPKAAAFIKGYHDDDNYLSHNAVWSVGEIVKAHDLLKRRDEKIAMKKKDILDALYPNNVAEMTKKVPTPPPPPPPAPSIAKPKKKKIEIVETYELEARLARARQNARKKAENIQVPTPVATTPSKSPVQLQEEAAERLRLKKAGKLPWLHGIDGEGS